MITIAKILNSKSRDDDIRKLLFPKPWKQKKGKRDDDRFTHCQKCGEFGENRGTIAGSRWIYKNKFCTVPDRIPLDWNLAKKKQAECNSEMVIEKLSDISQNFDAILHDIFRFVSKNKFDNFCDWCLSEAEPYHYLLAAAIAKEKNKKKYE